MLRDPSRIGKNIAAARSKIGLTQQHMADQLGLSRQTLIAFEKGQRAPSTEQLAKIGEALQIPVRDLVSLVASTDLTNIRFRTTDLQPEVAVAVQTLEDFGRRYATLEELLDQHLRRPALPPVALPRDLEITRFAEDVAADARRFLALGDGPLVDLRAVLEDQVGLRIFGIAELQSTQVDGLFAYSDELGALVGFKPIADSRRTNWTLCHEYAHFLTNRFDAEITYGSESRTTQNREERFANAFSASFLMPQFGISKRFSDILKDANGELKVWHLVLLAKEYGVSFEALIRRLEGIDRIRKGTLQHLRDSGFKPITAERALGIERYAEERAPLRPQRYEYLLAVLVDRGDVAEGEAARYLRVDRLSARELLQQYESVLAESPEANESLKEAIC